MEQSSKLSEDPCMHQHHDFKQEIADSIRRCEELLSMAPVLYQPNEGKSSGKKSSRSTTSARSEGRSDADIVTTSSMESERKSADVDPEWRKNMGLLMNRQEGTAAHVSPIGSPRAPSRPGDSTGYSSHKGRHLDESGEDQPIEQYNFTFDDSPHSSNDENIQQSISIRTRTVPHQTDEQLSGSEDWAYDRLGPASTLSTKTSSELTSKSESDVRGRAFNPTTELETFDAVDERYPEVYQVDEELPEQEQTAGRETELEGVCEVPGTCRTDDLAGSIQLKNTRSISGDYEVLTMERTATFPRSNRSSRSGRLGRSRDSGPSKGDGPPGSPRTKRGGAQTASSSKKPHSVIDRNTMSFSFTIPNHPKYAQDWEWLEECAGVDAKPLDGDREVEEQTENDTLKRPNIVLEGGRMRIGSAKIIKSDGKRFKVQKKFRSQRDASNCKKGRSPMRTPMQARLRNLSKPRTDLYQKFARTRAQLEAAHMSECSFRPKVGRRPNPHSQYSAPLIQRVGGIEQRVDLRKRARKVIEKEELDQCSFWPQINANSEYLDPAQYKPIEERAMDYQRRKEAKLARARAKEDMEMGLTFRPEINPKSLKIFKQTGLEVINLEDRLANTSSLHQDRRLKEGRGMPKSECTFTPEINRNTDIIMRASKLFEGCTPDFLSRQKYCMQVRENKQREKEEKIRQQTATFKPKTGNSDAILKDSPIAEMFDQSMYQRVDRLYHRDTERRQHIRQKISDAYYAQFSHQPEIDETSRILGRSATSYDLYKNIKGKTLKEQMKTSVEQNFLKSHPFQPKIARPRSSDTNWHIEDRKLVAHRPRRASAERMENVLHRRRQYRLEKARVLEEKKVIRELQEFKECTFKPIVNRVPPKDKEPVVVKGLGRHLELQDLAKQMKKDQEEWERKIFFQHVYALPKRQYTIPKPFSLCAGGRTRASKMLQQQAPENPSGGCVVQFKFQDKTMEEFHKKGPLSNSFYEASHPTPANPKWKDNTIWPTASEHPRFKHPLKELAFAS